MLALGVLLVACGGAKSAVRPGEAPSATSASTNGAVPGTEADAPRACAHGAKDFAPCVEDCDRGIVFGCTVAAARLERGEDLNLPRAVKIYERACELRDAAACVAAARMHVSGAGVPPSRARQIELLATACGLGDALACAIPAKAYAKGSGVPKDERRAKELREHACAGGAQDACDAIDDGTAPGATDAR